MSARKRAETELAVRGNEMATQRGIGWALLDLADAIRELKPAAPSEVVVKGTPPAPDPPPPGQNPAAGPQRSR